MEKLQMAEVMGLSCVEFGSLDMIDLFLKGQFMRRQMYFILSALLFVSCGKQVEKKTVIQEVAPVTQKQEAPSTSQTIEKEEAIFSIKRPVEIKDDLSNHIEFISNLNTYIISAELKHQKSSNARLVCKEINANKATQEISGFIDSETSVGKLQITLDKNATNSTEFTCKVLNEDKELISETKIKLLKDYVTQANMKAKNIGLIDGTNKIGALVLTEGALITDGMNLNISASEFVALPGSKIETFPENELDSDDGVAGVAGGIININAGRSIGELKVNLRGKNGGKSTVVDHSFKNFDPKTLKDCPNYELTEHTPSSTSTGTMTITIPGLALKKGSIAVKFDTKGVKGARGGNSGSIYIHSRKSNLEVSIKKYPGLGSKGGESYNPIANYVVEFLKSADGQDFFNPKTMKYIDFILARAQAQAVNKNCQALIRFPVVNELSAPSFGDSGEPGAELPSCISNSETFENICY